MYSILVIDDDVDMLNLYRFFLGNAGHSVHTLSNPMMAMDMIDHNDYSLIITDILMPGLNGIELTRMIQQKYPTQKIMVCSEGGTTDAREIVASIVLDKAVHFGAFDALRKPFTKQELLDRVNAVMNGASSLDQ